jgi:hypothetical protein
VTQPDSAPDDDSIRHAVARHRVRLSVYREYGPDERWCQRPVGLDFELRALVLGADPLIDLPMQRAAYGALHAIASWAFRVLDGSQLVEYAMDDFDDHVIMEGSSIVEVELAAHVLHRNDVRGALDDEERRAAEQVRSRLRSVGVRE